MQFNQFYAAQKTECTVQNVICAVQKSKLIKILVNICQILRPKCTNFAFDWSRPRWKNLQRSPGPL